MPNGFNASVQDVFTMVETAKTESLERLSSRIMYYGKVMDTLAQHHPEYVALVWGAMKLILTVCRNPLEHALSIVIC